MKLWEKQSIFSQNVAKLLQFISAHGFNATFGETYRTPEQALLDSKSGKGIAKSLHCERLAIDLNLLDRGGQYLTDKCQYQPFGEYWKSLHPSNKWGGDFPKLVDSNHFQMDL